jgi:RNA polymerase sigma factor (sigma-70 family)
MDASADHPSDLELVRAVLRRESRAIEALVQRARCIPRILALLNQRTGNALGLDDLNDLTQEVLIQLWPRLASYTGQAALETWFYGYCFNGLMNAVRKGRRAPRVTELPDALPGRVELGPTLDHEALELALAQLGSREQRIIHLKYYDELTFEEIGARLAISQNTAKTCFYRGLRRLQALMKKHGDRGGDQP